MKGGELREKEEKREGRERMEGKKGRGEGHND